MLQQNPSIRMFTSVFVLGMSAIVAVPASAHDLVVSPMKDLGGCIAVHAVQMQRTAVDCPADGKFVFCFTRELSDHADLISGTMEGYVDPAMGADIEHSKREGLYGALLKFITNDGVLEVMETGVYDKESGEWVGMSTITGGTGEFDGATGKLATFGEGDGAGMVLGSVCTK